MTYQKEDLLGAFISDERTQRVLGELSDQSQTNIHLKGLVGSGQAFAVMSAFKHLNDFHLVVLNNKEDAAYFCNDLQELCGAKKVFFFPSSARQPYHFDRTENANVLQRSEVLEALQTRKNGLIIVSYPEALAERVVTRKELKKNMLEVKRGMELSIEFVNELLFEFHFERVDFVTQPGQFAIRGGIVDIFSYAHETPYRIEFFGNDIDSIRSFDPASQLSEENFDRILIMPNILDTELHEERVSLLDYLSRKPIVWIDDIELNAELITKEYEKAAKIFKDLNATVKQLPPADLYMRGPGFLDELKEIRTIQIGVRFQGEPDLELEYKQRPQPLFQKNFEMLGADLAKTAKEGYENLILATSPKQAERLHSIFEDIEMERNYHPIMLPIHRGFIDDDLKIACYTDHQIFERYHRFKLKEGFRDAQQRLSLKELTEMQKGDYVVHVDHGVGEFAGLVTIDNDGQKQEAIKLVYKDKDALYVSIHSLHRISRYSGKDGTVPTVHKLGTKTWANLKNKTKKKIKELAFDLIQLYAKRKATKGFAYAPDGYLQNELEASFIYEDTPDQESATGAIKKDMESEVPMDRLICGDVGFGKTEVAIRAAFKAATDGKQVAVLVPTTILAMQHYRSFKERFADFPVEVDYVNRFRSTKQVRETLKRVAEGKVDILIGTHRLVSKDVKFKDLGLMIIDEEQKFGVSVKDKLKTMRVNVDTLTLTATPIPRTLQFSLMGARDLSVINTPPPNRQPVQTELIGFNEEQIRDAIRYELSRDGQVFIINNRVQNLQEVAGMVQRLVPDARVIMAHGQMDGKELEKRMMTFIEGEADVLVATTIIESGLDIPNANTIIINNAHQFGLSDLHQMRGRVGRSNKKAFCYLMSPPLSGLPSDARKRLNAVIQFSDLGSGLNIAMRDLDIRGAGNLLGGEQSGFINEVGIETYQKILNEAMKELKENEFKDLFADEITDVIDETLFETDLEIMLPHDYVNNVAERLSLYKKLAGYERETELAEFERELIDRFGPLPAQAKQMIDSMRLKIIGKSIGFEKIVLKSNKLLCYFIADPSHPFFESPQFGAVLAYVQGRAGQVELKQRNDKLYLAFNKVMSIEQALRLVEPLSKSLTTTEASVE